MSIPDGSDISLDTLKIESHSDIPTKNPMDLLANSTMDSPLVQSTEPLLKHHLFADYFNVWTLEIQVDLTFCYYYRAMIL
jgi:hypothetical protein